MEEVQIDDQKLYEEFESYIKGKKQQLRKVNKGDILTGKVVDVRPGSIIVDVGYKSEGIVAGKELRSDQVNISELRPGSEVLVYVVKPEDEKGQLVLSIRRTQQFGIWVELEKALKNKDIIEAVVQESNNGGLIVSLGDQVRGFIPTSQLDPARVYPGGKRGMGKDINNLVQKRLSEMVGETIRAKVMELDRERNKIILSEKMVTQARDLERREETLQKVKEGDVLEGEVSGITPFGVFINAQGLEGLVHLSELSWDKVEDINKLYSIGDKVKVMVIGISDGGKRVAYSIKRLQEDPWSKIVSKYKVGDIVEGTVQKVVDFGAFVRIDEGLNGLVHISEMSDRLVRNPRDIVKEGDRVKVRILSISSTERHLGLSLKLDAPSRVARFRAADARANVDKEALAEQVEEALEEVTAEGEVAEEK